MSKTLLAIGAHYDDCVYGVPGVLLQAVRKGHRVVVLNLIGNYSNFNPARGREEEFKQVSIDLAHNYGIEMRFLHYKSGQFLLDGDTKREAARVVADVRPDVAFALWRRDNHPDHEAASGISLAALRGVNRILDGVNISSPQQIYFYDNGPGHTIDFVPNTYVNVTEVWATALEWLGQLRAYVFRRTYSAAAPDGAQSSKTVLARYRGAACGAQFAEAMFTTRVRSMEIF